LRGILLVFSALLITGCASITPLIPTPIDSESAGLVIDLKVRVLGLATYRVDSVYFVKSCSDSDKTCNGYLITSNYAKEGRVYLLNAEPGEYRAVAVAFESGVFGDNSLYLTYLPSSLTNESAVQVLPRRLANAGSYLVSATSGVCPDSAESSQLKHAEMIEPGTPKCGIFKTLMHKLGGGDYLIVGGKAYLVGKQTYHYRGTTYEKQQDSKGMSSLLESAAADLVGTGWEGLTKAGH
jgi:hypothetical protein